MKEVIPFIHYLYTVEMERQIQFFKVIYLKWSTLDSKIFLANFKDFPYKKVYKTWQISK